MWGFGHLLASLLLKIFVTLWMILRFYTLLGLPLLLLPFCRMFCVATLTLGSWPRQGVKRLWAKRKTRESHHLLPGVQRMWENEPSHTQVNSHCGSWSPKWTLKSLECNFKGQNPWAWRVFYIIGKLSKRICLKWVHVAHLHIWNISYGQKKGEKSNCQLRQTLRLQEPLSLQRPPCS
jgi:hypothetical protein